MKYLLKTSHALIIQFYLRSRSYNKKNNSFCHFLLQIRFLFEYINKMKDDIWSVLINVLMILILNVQ